ncbi:hypothetical protein LX15_001148 [Streptoalloteichus tenebrarius]|uniref:Transposase n=1 Tax=Streptoalloteichus tenebrarius (strain ATCC 17920 / DSM 40477 / JCM 4838 / CBS 697.72 / NBRC 16177 / NCIMB 11028 / NRRL B-12390 / A12253. 1 / ISP 5477) TaxID=1933 RepID=A0ABT1HPL6_STRSD|nr:hypothetical protein [Streptoalloteichus tenebrarius]MCP2257463.1 hypothetical protein [Streptoalloteichus tenebrarius]
MTPPDQTWLITHDQHHSAPTAGPCPRHGLDDQVPGVTVTALLQRAGLGRPLCPRRHHRALPRLPYSTRARIEATARRLRTIHTQQSIVEQRPRVAS